MLRTGLKHVILAMAVALQNRMHRDGNSSAQDRGPRQARSVTNPTGEISTKFPHRHMSSLSKALASRTAVAYCENSGTPPAVSEERDKSVPAQAAKRMRDTMLKFNAARDLWSPLEIQPPQQHCSSQGPGDTVDRSVLAQQDADIKDRIALNSVSKEMLELHGKSEGNNNKSFLLRLSELANRLEVGGARSLTKQHILLFVEECLALCAGKLGKMGEVGRSREQRLQAQELATSVCKSLLSNFGETIVNNPELSSLFGVGTEVDPADGDIDRQATVAVERILNVIDLAINNESVEGNSTSFHLVRQACDILRLPAPSKPVAVIPAESRVVDAHTHASSCYHAGHDVATRLSTTGPTFNNHGTSLNLEMAIPHTLKFPDNKDRSLREFIQAYYADKMPEGNMAAEFCRRDAVSIEHFNELPQELQKFVHPTMTGIEMINDPESIARNNAAAEAFSENYVTSCLNAGDKDIMVVFGEMTAHKPAVPQRMLSTPSIEEAGEDKHNVVDGVTKIVSGLMLSSLKGASRALRRFEEANPAQAGAQQARIQHRVCLHCDAVPHSDTQLDMRDVGAYIANIDKVITEHENADKATPDQKGEEHEGVEKQSTHQFVFQPAHFFGASVENYQDVSRTTVAHQLIETTRSELITVRVQADLSWYTATARNISTGMAAFLSVSESPEIKALGEMLANGDDFQHNGFSYMNLARKAESIAAEKHGSSIESTVGKLLSTAAQEKSIRIFQGFVGEAFHAITESPELVQKLNNYIKDGVTIATAESAGGHAKPGNFTGLLYHLREGTDLGVQGKTPFIHGSDTLGTLSKYDGDLVAQIDATQHQSTLAILAALIIGLKATGSPEDAADAAIYQAAFDDIHYGGADESERSFFAESNHNYKNDVSTEGYTDTQPSQEMTSKTRNSGERALWQGRQALSVKPDDIPALGLSGEALRGRGKQLHEALQSGEPVEGAAITPKSSSDDVSPLYQRSSGGHTKIVQV